MNRFEAIAQLTVKRGGMVSREKVEVEIDDETYRLSTFPAGREKLKAWAMSLFPGADSVAVDNIVRANR